MERIYPLKVRLVSRFLLETSGERAIRPQLPGSSALHRVQRDWL